MFGKLKQLLQIKEKESEPGIEEITEGQAPNTDQITRRHLELAYQFVLSSRLSPGINLR